MCLWLLQRCQTGVQQSPRVGRIVDTKTLVFVRDVDPVPQCLCSRFRIIADNGVITRFVEGTGCDQERPKRVELLLNLGLRTVNIEIFCTRVTGLAGIGARQERVVLAFTEVAGDACIGDAGIVQHRTAILTSAAETDQHGALWTMVWSPVRAGNGDHTVHSVGDRTTRLMAVCAQIALTAFKRRAQREQFDGICRRQGPVCLRAGHMDLVARATILTDGRWVSDTIGIDRLARFEHVFEGSTRVTCSAATSSTSVEKGTTIAMNRLLPEICCALEITLYSNTYQSSLSNVNRLRIDPIFPKLAE